MALANESIGPLGPQFGPDFILLRVNEKNGPAFELEVYPDANNPLLKKNGLAMQFYFVPQRVYLAKKQNSPKDYDFGMTIFKGLLTTEDTVAITDAMTSSGELSTGGGICSFSTTFAIPESVIQGAIDMLKAGAHPVPPPKIANLFARNLQDPAPLLGIVPILENNVTIEVPHFADEKNAPFFINAQGNGKGSIEASSISSFLVTLNSLAAGAVVGSLQKGISPFTVHYNLKQLYYINACDIHMNIDVDKVFDHFSMAADVHGFFGRLDASFQAAYQSCITSGAIKTIIKMAGADVDQALKTMIDQQVSDMQTRAIDLVKTEIFDWHPSEDHPATATKTALGGLFGGAAVSIKKTHQKKGLHLQQDFRIDTSVSKDDTVSGNLNDLAPAIKANLDDYLAVVDIGEWFKKIQVAATTNVNWSEKLPDGTDLRDPIKAVQIEVAYPDYSSAAVNELQLKSQANGFHYTPGHKDPSQGGQLARWTADNPNDIINVAFLRLDKSLPKWDSNQVKVTKIISYDPSDPRVEISGNKTTVKKEEILQGGAVVIDPDEVGLIHVRFALAAGPLPDYVTVTLTCKIGKRTDTLTITNQNQKNVVWEIFSDKYFNTISFQYTLQVTVNGPTFLDAPIQFETPQPLIVPLPTGRLKYLGTKVIPLPSPSAEQAATLAEYLKRFGQAKAVAGAA